MLFPSNSLKEKHTTPYIVVNKLKNFIQADTLSLAAQNVSNLNTHRAVNNELWEFNEKSLSDVKNKSDGNSPLKE